MILSSIVATSRVDVQRGVSYAVMWPKARKPFLGLEIQFLRTTGAVVVMVDFSTPYRGRIEPWQKLLVDHEAHAHWCSAIARTMLVISIALNL